MERKHVPESEKRLIILYALRRLGSVTAMQLLQFLVEIDLMNYFAMQLALADMQEQGQLTSRPHPLGDLIEMTPAGEYALDTFASRVPVSRRKAIDRAAPAWRQRFRAEQMAPADSFVLQGGGCCLRLRLLEGSSALMQILLTLPEEASLTFLQKRWHSAAQAVYDAITLSLSDGFQPSEPAASLPVNAVIQPSGPREWMLSLTDNPDEPTITLLLTLADERLAHHYAAAWPEKCQALRDLILLKLREGLGGKE